MGSSEVGAYFDNRVAQLRQVLLNNLIYVGESAVREARENHRYKDQTGNLTSSIGYCVLDNGSVVKSSSFERVKNGTDGSAKGREFLNSLISEHSSGLVLIRLCV